MPKAERAAVADVAARYAILIFELVDERCGALRGLVPPEGGKVFAQNAYSMVRGYPAPHVVVHYHVLILVEATNLLVHVPSPERRGLRDEILGEEPLKGSAAKVEVLVGRDPPPYLAILIIDNVAVTRDEFFVGIVLEKTSDFL